jgi:RecA-family ATPase
MFDFLNAATLNEHDFNDQTEYVIDGFLAKNMITMIYADGGNGKSWLGLGLAGYCAALNMPVIYLDFDNPLTVLRDRGVNQKLVARYPNLQYIQRSKWQGSAFDMLECLSIRATGGAYKGAVVVIDSLRNFADIENNAKIMVVMDMLMNIREAGATIIVLHHSNKDGKNYQGSNNIRNSVDNMFRLEKLELSTGIGTLLIAVKERCAIQDKAFDICPHSLELTERDLLEAKATEDDLEFIKQVKDALFAQPNLNKTAVLEATGATKDDKTARARLDKYDGIYWQSKKNHTRIVYSLQPQQPLQHSKL